MVFPLGMYAAATFRLSRALPFAPLEPVARVFLPLALAAWTAAAFGLARRLAGAGPRDRADSAAPSAEP
jgi:hypothetical protein